MRRDEVEALVAKLAEEACAGLGLDFVDCTFRKSDRAWRMLVRLDRATGVSIGDCAQVSRLLSARLDEMDPVDCQYTLEVSSAGLSTPLRTDRDFSRFVGRRIEVEVNNPGQRDKGGGRRVKGRLVGELVAFDDDRLTLEGESGVVEVVERSSIRRARPAVDFKGAGAIAHES